MKKIFCVFLLFLVGYSLMATGPIEIEYSYKRDSWTPYIGNRPMEEETFFQLTGYPDEAWEAGRLKTYKKTLKIYTGASILAGTLMLGAGYLYAPALGDAAAPVAYTAGGILFSSLVSLVLLKLAPDNYASLSYAQRIADDYNAGLK